MTHSFTSEKNIDTQFPTRLFELLENQLQKFPLKDCVATKVKGKWQLITTQDIAETANRMSLGFLKMGIVRGDKVAIISNNRPEWNMLDFGLQQIGAVSVPMYPTITEAEYKFIFTDAAVKLIFVSSEELYEKAKNASAGLVDEENIFSFDKINGVKHWKEIEKLAENEEVSALESHKKAVLTDDLLTLIYTSGTTGTPKGVMLSHKNILTNISALEAIDFPLTKGKARTLSFLPLCHVFERTAMYYFINHGVSVYYAESIDNVAENLREVKPDMFNTVPRLLEKVYDRIVAKAHELPELQRRIFNWAVELGFQYQPHLKPSWFYKQQLKIADKIVFKKWREALGGNIKFVVSSGAALQPRLGQIFTAAGIKILEAYGQTEASPGISFMHPDDIRIGTVGEAMQGVTIKIAEDGEVLVKGENVMLGYYNRPDLTAQTIDEEGWLHTGDIGELVEGKFLKITDRKKEMFKTSGGKYIAPQVLENKLKESSLVEQVMVIGENRKFPAALIVPAFNELEMQAKNQHLTFSNHEQLLDLPEIKNLFKQEIDTYNENFAHYEQIKKFVLLPEPWTLQTGELTPTLKLKRKFINQKFEKEIEGLY